MPFANADARLISKVRDKFPTVYAFHVIMRFTYVNELTWITRGALNCNILSGNRPPSYER